MLKMVEDGLVSTGVLPGDDPSFVASITVTAEKVAKDAQDQVTVTIIPTTIGS